MCVEIIHIYIVVCYIYIYRTTFVLKINYIYVMYFVIYFVINYIYVIYFVLNKLYICYSVRHRSPNDELAG